MSFKKEMGNLFQGSNASAGLYTLLLGMATGNILPSPSDALYMKLQAGLRDKWKRGEISAEQYWKLNSLYYYFVPFTYWAFLALIVINIKASSEQKIKIAGALVGSGIAVGIILKLMQNDKKQLMKEDEERDLLIKQHPEIIDILKKPEYENIAGQIVGNSVKGKTDSGGEYIKLFAEKEAELNK
jgi:hypothetical protein